MSDEPGRSGGVSRSVRVEAAPERVWALVCDLPRMGDFSPENTGGRWVGGATGPAVGAVFAGRNARGPRRWSTRATVTDCLPGRRFAFRVSAVGLPASRWSYDIEPDGTGCTVTESWQDERGWLLRALGGPSTGVRDRAAFTAHSIERTLAAVKERAEQETPAR